MSEVANTKIVIREALPGADERLIRNLRASVGWSTLETGLAAMAAGRSVVYVMEVDGRPAASGALVLMADDPDLANGNSHALVSNLIVDSDSQGMGLGSRLLSFLEAQAEQRGSAVIAIGVDISNVRARALYERKGYRPFKQKNEAWGEVIYLSKPLAATSL